MGAPVRAHGPRGIEPERGQPLQIEHLDDPRAAAAQLEMRAVGCDRGVRAGSLRDDDVAGVVHETGNRVSRCARGQCEQERQRERGSGAAPSFVGARSQPTVVVTARAIQITALVRHQAQ